MELESGDGPSRALLITAIVVAVGALVAVLVVAALRQSPPTRQAVAIVAVPAPEATGAECRTLLDALPDELGDVPRAPVIDPAPPGAAAWGGDGDSAPIILRCGLDRPAEFVVGAALQAVDEVQWFRIADVAGTTWYAVDRPVYVALTLPPDSGPTPIQQISAALARTLPARPLDPAPVR